MQRYHKGPPETEVEEEGDVSTEVESETERLQMLRC